MLVRQGDETAEDRRIARLRALQTQAARATLSDSERAELTSLQAASRGREDGRLVLA